MNADFEELLESRKRDKCNQERLYRAAKEAEAQEQAEADLRFRRAKHRYYLAGTLAFLAVTYFCVLAASAGEIPAGATWIPLTFGFSAAFLWGRYSR